MKYSLIYTLIILSTNFVANSRIVCAEDLKYEQVGVAAPGDSITQFNEQAEVSEVDLEKAKQNLEKEFDELHAEEERLRKKRAELTKLKNFLLNQGKYNQELKQKKTLSVEIIRVKQVPSDNLRKDSPPLKVYNPKKKRPKLTRLRVLGNPVGVWRHQSSLVLSEVRVTIRNAGTVAANNIKVVAEIPGGAQVELSGPKSLSRYEKALYSATPDLPVEVKGRAPKGRIRVKPTCENCRKE